MSCTFCVLPAATDAGALIDRARSAPVLTVVVSLCEEPPTTVAVTVIVPAAVDRTRIGRCVTSSDGTLIPVQVTVPGPGSTAMPPQLTPAGRVPAPAKRPLAGTATFTVTPLRATPRASPMPMS